VNRKTFSRLPNNMAGYSAAADDEDDDNNEEEEG
jgi:hypothetical protein